MFYIYNASRFTTPKPSPPPIPEEHVRYSVESTLLIVPDEYISHRISLNTTTGMIVGSAVFAQFICFVQVLLCVAHSGQLSLRIYDWLLICVLLHFPYPDSQYLLDFNFLLLLFIKVILLYSFQNGWLSLTVLNLPLGPKERRNEDATKGPESHGPRDHLVGLLGEPDVSSRGSVSVHVLHDKLQPRLR